MRRLWSLAVAAVAIAGLAATWAPPASAAIAEPEGNCRDVGIVFVAFFGPRTVAYVDAPRVVRDIGMYGYATVNVPERLAVGPVTLRTRGPWMVVSQVQDGGNVKRFANGDTEVRWPDGRRYVTVRIDRISWLAHYPPAASISASVVGARCTAVLYAM